MFEDKSSLLETATEEYWLSKLSSFKAEQTILTGMGLTSSSMFILNERTNASIRKFSKENALAEFTLFLTGFGLLLDKIIHADRVLIASPDISHSDPGHRNTLFYRLEIDDQVSLRTALMHVQAEVRSVLSNTDFKFERLKEKFALREIDLTAIVNYGINYRPLTSARLDEGIPLQLHMGKTEDGYQGHFVYSAALYDASFIAALSDGLITLWEQFADKVDLPVSSLSVSHFQAQTLSVARGKSIVIDPSQNVIRSFERIAEASPGLPAVFYEGEILSYGELNDRANQLAKFLLDVNASSQPVGIILDRSSTMIIAILAVIKSGAAYVPIDPAFPSARIAYIIGDTALKVVITSSDHLDLLSNFEGRVFAVDIQLDLLAYPPGNPASSISPESIAYIIYTSGSTGEPKGVMIDHKALTNLLAGLNDSVYAFADHLRIALIAPIVFDPSVQQIFFSLMYGHTLYVVPDKIKTSGEALWNYFAQKAIQATDGTPSHLSLLVDSPPAAHVEIVLQHLLIGGEVLARPLCDDFRSLLNGLGSKARIINLYGPTECCVDTTYQVVDPQSFNSIPIGQPLPNIQVLIIDEDLKVLPKGAVGEICITGEGVGRGYWRNEELTGQKFVESTLSVFDTPKKIYRTGDMGKMLPNGIIEFKGRKDRQVKLRGYRIDLNEIEFYLLRNKHIRQSIVVLRTGKAGSFLACYFVADEPVPEKEVRAELLLHLPQYMVPEHIVQLPVLPLTANGKVDTKALPDPNLIETASDDIVEPETKLQKEIAAMWSDILGRQRISLKHNFFDLGGHSLRAAQLISRIHKRINRSVNLVDVFAYPVLEDFVGHVAQSASIIFDEIKQVTPQPYYDLSHAQKRLWVLDQLNDEKYAYNIGKAFQVNGSLDVTRFQRCFDEIIFRHESLRTSFCVREGEPKQVIHQEVSFQVEVVDGKDTTAEGISSRMEDIIKTSFDLAHAPLLRGVLIRISDQQSYFVLVIHHIISDGWSLGVLVKEIMTLYNNRTSWETALAPLPIHYKDYTYWHENILSGSNLARLQHYWWQKLSGELPAIVLPYAHKRPLVKTFSGRHYTAEITAHDMAEIHRYCKEKNISLFMFILASVKTLLHRYSGQDDIIVGVPVAGRDHHDLEDQIGFYVNTLPLRTFINSEETFDAFAERIKSNLLDAYEHQLYPFDRLVNDLDLHRDLSRNPLFDVMVVLQNTGYDELTNARLGEAIVTEYQTEYYVGKFDLTFNFRESEQGILLTYEYNTDLFAHEAIDRLARSYTGLIRQIVEQHGEAIQDLEIVPEDERGRIIHQFNGTETDVPANKTIHELIGEQVARTPGATAVVWQDKTLTYLELDEKSNRIAHYLRSVCHVRPDDRIAVITDRNDRMIMAILGVLKSGAAYVPIDPQYPNERIEYILNDSNPAFVMLDAADCNFEQPANTLRLSTLLEDGTYSLNDHGSPGSSANLAYVIYTSGSTGFPKGVMISHRNAIAFLDWCKREFAASDFDIVHASTSYCFDLSVFEIFFPLCIGKRVRIVENGIEARTFFGREQGIMFNTVPSVVEQLLREGETFDGVSILNMAGEPIPRSVQSSLKNVTFQVRNLYGPTEDTTYSTCYRISGEEEIIPIGKPISNSQVWILDEKLKILPIGVKGQICLSGAGLALGYLHNDRLTNEKFIPHPYKPGERLYKTGDIGRWLPDGNIEFFGRIDHQVKLRGYRIEPGEIEQTLEKQDFIEKALVEVFTDSNEEKCLVAYYTCWKDVDEQQLRGKLAAFLPSYMLPSYFVRLTGFPLTLNGKIDRKVLPKPEANNDQRVSLAPGTETEARLMAIWNDVLGKEVADIRANFFEIGGHSLKGMQIITRISKQFHVDVSLKQVFLNPTVEGLARIIDQSVSGRYQPIPVVPQAAHYALSHAQKRVWILSQFEEGRITYNMCSGYRLMGDLDVGRLEAGFADLISRHESLRTSFIVVNGEPRQKIHRPENFEFGINVTDLRKKSGKEAHLQRLCRQISHQVFDLEKGPLIRVDIFRLASKEHVLLLTMHHIIADAWSLEIMMRELLLSYSGLKDAVPTLLIQYKDYADWQLKRLKEDTETKSYWLNKLSAPLPVMELPADYSRPSVKNYKGGHVFGSFDQEMTSQLYAYSQAKGISLFMLLLTGLKVLLYRYSGQTDIIVGSPVAGRIHSDLENQIGFYVNTLALRTQLEADETFGSLLERVKEATLSAFENQSYPFDRLVDDLDLPHDLSRSPLFDVMLQVQNTEGERTSAPDGIVISGYHVDFPFSKFDLNITCKEVEGSLAVSIEYNSELFKSSRVSRMLEHYKRLLLSAVSNDTCPVDELDCLAPEEVEQLLGFSQGKQVEHKSTASVITLLQEQAERTPDRKAIIFGNAMLTYRQVHEKSNQLAHLLRAAFFVANEVPVGVYLPRSEQSVLAMLGILKAGGTYLPLDKDLPPARLNFIIQDALPRVMITTRQLGEKAAAWNVPLVYLEGNILDGYSADNLPVINKPGDTAYVIYTSGSTGNPKGVKQTYRMLYNLVDWDIRYSGIETGLSHLQYSSFSFDSSLHDALHVLAGGGVLHVAGEDIRTNWQSLLQCIITQQIEIVSLPFSALSNFFQQLEIEQFHGHAIRHIISTGEQLMVNKNMELFLETYPNVQLHNFYGPSETHVVTSYRMSYGEGLKLRAPIGKPLTNTSLYILDAKQKTLPTGVYGELYIGGANLGSGYVNLPEQEQKRFVTYKAGDREELVYRTGDICRWMEDGNIEYAGRSDGQLKIRGYRVELGEIEIRTMGIPGVENTVVVAVAERDGTHSLAAYYTGSAEASIIKETLRDHLPEYMVPLYLVRLESLPLTPNGKVDKRALPSVTDLQSAGRLPYKAPSTATERKLAAIWAEVLSRDTIGINDNFFELGGHSLKAMQVVSRISKKLRIDATLKQVFQHPTIEELGALLERIAITEYIPIPGAPESPFYDLSPGQKRLWILAQFGNSDHTFHLASVYELNGALDTDAIKLSFDSLIERHEILRTALVVVDGVPKQKIHPPGEADFAIRQWDLRTTPDKDQQCTIVCKEEAYRPFDLAHGPLLRAALIRMSDERYVFCFTMHHIISDQWSMEVLVREVLGQYQRHKAGVQVRLPPLKVQYKDYAVWLNQELSDERLITLKEYWHGQLRWPIPVLELPTDYPRPKVKTQKGKRLHFVLSDILGKGLKRLSADYESTLFITLLAGLKCLLFRYTGQEDIIVGSPVAGRNHRDLEDQIGFYVNMLPLRTMVTGAESFEQLLVKVRETLLAGFDHQAYPFDKLVDELQIERDVSRAPLFDVGFTWLSPVKTDLLPDVDIEINRIPLESDIAMGDLWFYGQETDDGVALSLEYNTDLFLESTARQMVAHYISLLEQVVLDSHALVHEINYLSQDEKLALLEKFHGPLTDYPHDVPLQVLFQEQVLKAADSVAVVYKGKRLTYQALNEQSNQLAHYLRDQYSIGPDDKVGILLDRSEELIVAILGVIKSSGAYVPIDPTYPPERIRYMLQETGIKVLITDSGYLFGLPAYYSGTVLAWDIQSEWRGYALENPPVISSSRNLAYVMFTSGSTGTPKGVMVEQRSITRLVRNTNYITFYEGDRLLQTGSIAFDASTFEIWGMLLNGGTLHLLDGNKLLDLTYVERYVKEEDITLLWLTSSLFNEYADICPQVFSNLRYVIAGGDNLSPKHIRKIRLQYPRLVLMNGYGPTENTTFSICHAITEAGNSIPIGVPIANSTAYILDAWQSLVPAGVTGEIYVGGDGLARGYLGNGALTAEKFIPHPFEEGEKLYRTGDLGRLSREGVIEFIGRRDNQVKIRGFRVELGEIEEALSNYHGVEKALVIVREDKEGHKYLAGYFTSPVDISIDSLRASLAMFLPDYMLPAFLVKLPTFPLTPNGKVDRRNLPDPLEIGNESGYEPPATVTESKLVDIWQEVLGRQPIGINDNFFHLGGDSIKAIRVVSHINKLLQTFIEVKDIFQFQNIASLCRYIAGGIIENSLLKAVAGEMDSIKTAITGNAERASVLPDDWEDIYPMSDIQQGMLYHSLLHQGSGIYHDQLFMRIVDDGFDFDRFRKSLVLLTEKHAMLRTSFHVSAFGSPVQIVHKKSMPEVTSKDLVGLAEDQQKEYIRRDMKADLDVGFDPAKRGLWRVCVYRLNESECGVLWMFHHAIMDGWSIATLQTELSNVYFELKHDASFKPSPLSSTYKDYVIDQSVVKRDAEIRAFWLNYLREHTRTPMPLVENVSRSEAPTYRTYFTMIDPTLGAALEKVAKHHQLHIKDIFLAAFLYLLKITTNTRDIVTGLVTHGRPSVEDADRVVGCFLNTIPFRYIFAQPTTIEDFIRSVSQQTRIIKRYDKLPLSDIVELTQTDNSENPFFDMIFNFLDFHIFEEGHPGAVVKESFIADTANTNTYFDFTISKARDENYQMSINHLDSLYSEEDIRRIAGYYEQILERLTQDVGSLLDSTPVIEGGKARLAFHATPAKPSDGWLPDVNAFTLPRTQLEHTLRELWSEILSLPAERISVTAGFHAMGGHSLKVIRLLNRIQKKFSVEIQLKELFANPTIQEQATLIGKGTFSQSYTIQPINGRELYELSPPQLRLWMLHQLEGDALTYNICGTTVLSDDTDQARLVASIQTLVKRHEALRTVFILKNDTPWQYVIPEEGINFSLDEYEDLASAEEGVYGHIFNIGVWPLFKIAIVRENGVCHFVYNFHHIICDGWSMEVLLRDLITIYSTGSGAAERSLPVLPIQYRDYAHWYNEALASGRLSYQHQYWMRKLNGDIPHLRLPSDYSGLSVTGNGGAGYYNFYLREELTSSIDVFLKEQNVPLSGFFIACFKVLLHRLTDEKDLIVGIPVANRAMEEVKDLIGLFLNTVMLRDEVDTGMRFDALLLKVNQTLIEGLENQLYPFEKILDGLKITQDFNQFPVSPVFLNFLSFDSTAMESVVDFSDGHSNSRSATRFDIECYFKQFKNAIEIGCLYRNDLFKKETIEYWMNGLVAIIETVVHEPSIKVGDIRFFERTISLPTVPVNVAFRDFTPEEIDQSIVARFEKQVATYPHNIAIGTGDLSMSYRHLNELANGLAFRIREVADGETGNVGLLLDHGVNAVTGILGVLKSGNTYVPLDPDHPEARILYMLRDADCRIIITDMANGKLADKLARSATNVTIVSLEDACRVVDNPGIYVDPRSNAYILYTSGSTGQPKGVIQNNRNVLHFIRVYTNNLHLHEDDRLSLIPTYCFDASVMDIFGALLNGASLWPFDIRRNSIEGMSAWLAIHRISILHTVPTIYRYFTANLAGQVFDQVRLVVLGGEAVYLNDLTRFKSHFTAEAIFINGYGPTESTVTLQKFLRHSSDLQTKYIPLGRPVPFTDVYLLDQSDVEVGIYQVGEIVYKSEFLAVGYLNNREQTEKVFTKDPVTGVGRVYRSGDLGRRLPTGEIEFVGRKDDQVKHFGQRIELLEIEQCLLGMPGVEEAVVLLRKAGEDDALVAYVRTAVPSPGKKEIAAYLQARLPHYMVPRVYKPIDVFPLTATGKINRLALPEVSAEDIRAQRDYQCPETSIEKEVAGIWADILEVSAHTMGVNDNFFEQGGNSLKAIRVLSRINKRYGVQLGAKALFADFTIRALAGQVANNSGFRSLPLQPLAAQTHYDLSNAQKRLWILHQLFRDQAIHHMHDAYSIKGFVSEEALRYSLEKMVQRHELLRTSFCALGDEVKQQIHTLSGSDELTVTDLSQHHDAASVFQSVCAEVFAKPFDLEQVPLWRIHLLKLAEDDYVLLVCFHHIIFDGWSKQLFLAELGQWYNHKLQSRSYNPSPLSVQYKDYASWSNQLLKDNEYAVKLGEYWRRQFEGVSWPARIGARVTVENGMEIKANHVTVFFDEQLCHTLKPYAASRSSSIFCVLMSSVKALLSLYSADKTIIVGTSVAGRILPELEDQLGLYVNLLPLVTVISPSDTLQSLFQKVHYTVNNGLEHQQYPFDTLVEDLNIKRESGRHPIFDVLMVLQEPEDIVREQVDGFDNLQVTSAGVAAEQTFVEYDLTFSFRYINNVLSLSLLYKGILFSAEEIALMVKRYEAILRLMMSHQQITMNQLKAEVNKSIMDSEHALESSPNLNIQLP